MLDELMGEKEEVLQNYLEANEKILVAACGIPSWFYQIVIPRFRFGSDYVSDFVLVNGQSSNYSITLIELEPATSELFTQKGDYTQRLNHAIKQVNDWEDWIARNEQYFKDTLLKAIRKKYPSFDEKFDYARRFVIYKKIIIGRRNKLNEDNNKCRALELKNGHCDIITYDRLINIEKKIIELKEKGIDFSEFWKFDERFKL